MVIRDKRLQFAKPISNYSPGDVIAANGEYYMLTDNNLGAPIKDNIQICVNVQSGALTIFNKDFNVLFAPSEVYVE